MKKNGLESNSEKLLFVTFKQNEGICSLKRKQKRNATENG